MRNRSTLFTVFAALTLAVSGLAFAHGGGGMGGGSMMGGSGMMVVADDGSLLVTNMDMNDMMGGGGSGGSAVSRELINISSDGTERWRVSFTEGWPMMPTTDGNLVVVVLVNDWFMGNGGNGDGGMGGGMDGSNGGNGGGMGGGNGGGMMGARVQAIAHGGDEEDGDVVVVGLDLATGTELWRSTIQGDMGGGVQFSPNGSQIYLSIREMGMGGGPGNGPMEQGDAAGSGMLTSSTIIALDRNGNQLWSYQTGNDSGNGGTGGGMNAARR